MKKGIILMSCSLILLTACSKDEVTNPADETQADSVYVVTNTDGINNLEVIPINQSQVNSKVTPKRGSSLNAHGDFGAFNGGSVTFNGVQNNGVTNGSAEVQITFGPFGGARVIMQTESLISVGDNEVIYGGYITEVLENTIMFPPPPPGAPAAPCDPFDLGTYSYFRVLDNGQGSSAPADQYRGIIFNSCDASPSLGNDLPWFLAADADVENPSDKIKVND